MQKMCLNHGFSDKQFATQGTRYKRPRGGDCESTRGPSRGSTSQNGKRLPCHCPRIENSPGRFGQSDRAGGTHSESDSHDLDRKSTRLNSSHEWISYAVFCLKK